MERFFLNDRLLSEKLEKRDLMVSQLLDKKQVINDGQEISEEDIKLTVSVLKNDYVETNPRAINDDSFDTSIVAAADQGVLTLGSYYYNELKNDPLERAIKSVNVLKFGMRKISYNTAKLIGIPDIYDDYNKVPIVSEMTTTETRKVLALQVAVQRTLTEEFQGGAGGASFGLDPSSLLDRRRRYAADALFKSSRLIRANGFPSLDVYGMYNAPNLPAAVPVDPWTKGDPEKTYEQIATDINAMASRLANQLEIPVGELKVFLVVPAKYEYLFYTPASKYTNETILERVNATYKNIEIIFSNYDASKVMKPSTNTDLFLMFSQNIYFYNGAQTSPFVNLVGLTYVDTAISEHRVSLKANQELYVLTTAGVILISPRDVVVTAMKTS